MKNNKDRWIWPWCLSFDTKMIWTPPGTDAIIINLVSKIECKPRIEWNRDLMHNESMNLGMWGCHIQLWTIWLISQEFECHENPISSKSLFKNQRELTLSPIASKLIFSICWMWVLYMGLVTKNFGNKSLTKIKSKS